MCNVINEQQYHHYTEICKIGANLTSEIFNSINKLDQNLDLFNTPLIIDQLKYIDNK